jgi:hypothetical protein
MFVRNYSATTAESVAALSAAKESTVSTAADSSTTATESESDAAASLAALFPQDAKETATKATNKNTNFFIFLLLLKICNTYLLY